MYNCKYCSNHVSPNKSGNTRHEKHCVDNPNRVPQHSPWNKGITMKDAVANGIITAEAYDRINVGIRKGISSGRGSTLEKEIERKRKISEKAKQNNGGYRQGSGRGKKGWYKGFFCDSSWELAYVIFCLEHDISIMRNTEKRQYIHEGKVKNYIPDFIVDGCDIVEIKGYRTKEWESKLEANPDVTVLYESDLKHVFDYVTLKYGKDYVRLYESQ